MSDLTPIGDIFAGMRAAAASASADRAPLDPTRVGVVREPLPRLVRTAVLIRDQFTCRWCHITAHRGESLALEVDHIVPWSAGGADHPVNLRTLCGPCNQKRSNRTTDLDRRALPIGSGCWTCFYPDIRTIPTVRGYCLNCRDFRAIAYRGNLLIGGVVPVDGIPDARGGDEDYSALDGLRPDAVKQLDHLRQRAIAQTVDCPHCAAPAGQPCVVGGGSALRGSPAHPSRIEASS